MISFRVSKVNRQKKHFPLFKESQLFEEDKRREVLQNVKLPEHGEKVDDDVDTDEDVVKYHKKACLKELRVTLKAYLNGNPFEQVRNLRTP